MKKLILFLIIVLGVTLTGCKKKEKPEPIVEVEVGVYVREHVEETKVVDGSKVVDRYLLVTLDKEVTEETAHYLVKIKNTWIWWSSGYPIGSKITVSESKLIPYNKE